METRSSGVFPNDAEGHQEMALGPGLPLHGIHWSCPRPQGRERGTHGDRLDREFAGTHCFGEQEDVEQDPKCRYEVEASEQHTKARAVEFTKPGLVRSVSNDARQLIVNKGVVSAQPINVAATEPDQVLGVAEPVGKAVIENCNCGLDACFLQEIENPDVGPRFQDSSQCRPVH